MTICSSDPATDIYQALNHLFFAAKGSPTWGICRSYTASGREETIEYENEHTGARIIEHSSDYQGGVPTRHVLTFKHGADE